jgi:AcrR family transcriptional regulator
MVPANIYWHFPSKHDLLNEVLHSLYQLSYEELASSIGEGSASERLTDYVKAYVRIQLTVLDENCNFSYASLASSLTPEARRELMRAGRPYIELLREIMRQGVQAGEFEIDDLTVTSLAVSSMCEYIFTWYRSGQRLSEAEVQEHYAGLVLRMVRAESRP